MSIDQAFTGGAYLQYSIHSLCFNTETPHRLPGAGTWDGKAAAGVTPRCSLDKQRKGKSAILGTTGTRRHLYHLRSSFRAKLRNAGRRGSEGTTPQRPAASPRRAPLARASGVPAAVPSPAQPGASLLPCSGRGAELGSRPGPAAGGALGTDSGKRRPRGTPGPSPRAAGATVAAESLPAVPACPRGRSALSLRVPPPPRARRGLRLPPRHGHGSRTRGARPTCAPVPPGRRLASLTERGSLPGQAGSAERTRHGERSDVTAGAPAAGSGRRSRGCEPGALPRLCGPAAEGLRPQQPGTREASAFSSRLPLCYSNLQRLAWS